jgi:hypothetical protein
MFALHNRRATVPEKFQVNSAIGTAAARFLNFIAFLPIDFSQLMLKIAPVQSANPVHVNVCLQKHQLASSEFCTLPPRNKADDGKAGTEH